MKRRKTPWLKKGDWVIVGSLLFLGVVTWSGIRFLINRNPPGKVSIVTADTSFSLPLADTVINITGPIGPTTIQIEDKRVWVEKASCPQKTCARQGKISRIGESIVCLPNKIVITIEGESDVDAISY